MKLTSDTAPIKTHQTTLMVAALVSLLLWIVPFFGFILLPLQYLNTHLHEFSHALMGILTGGDVANIHVFGNGSGVTLIGGGSPYLVDSAGYVGATIIGALMIWFSRSERGAAITLRVIACLLLFSFVFWVRGDVVGFVAGLFWLGLLAVLPSVLKGRQLVFVGQLLGMQQCVASMQALYVLLRISVYPGIPNDAANMSTATGVPAIVWALTWGAIGLGTLYVTLRAAWISRPQG